MEVCKICGSAESKVIYFGPIRTGRYGSLSKEKVQLRRCRSCEAIGLPSLLEDQAEYYESASYREEVDGSGEVENFFQLHDREQLRNLSAIGLEGFRSKRVADIGCGAGSFLDAVRGYAREVIAIEPSKAFRASLERRGYRTYPYAKDAIEEQRGQIDMAVSFSVVEHVSDPLSFLREIFDLLASDGELLISTPNANDILIEALPECYPSFFYRKAHLWYFSPTAVENLLNLSGYEAIQIIPRHRFGLANFLGWLRDRMPKGESPMDFITPAMNAAWITELERTLRCDYLYAKARKR